MFNYERRVRIDNSKQLLLVQQVQDEETYNHEMRVSLLVEYFSDILNMPSDQKEVLITSAKLHDIGKLLVPKSILKKPTFLTREEFGEIAKHPLHGTNLLIGISPDVAQAILHHHERFDGTGYPKGLKGDKIPLASRIISIFDSLDAMISKRCYSSPTSFDDAFNEIITLTS